MLPQHQHQQPLQLQLQRSEQIVHHMEEKQVNVLSVPNGSDTGALVECLAGRAAAAMTLLQSLRSGGCS
jgi:hypothetical protein